MQPSPTPRPAQSQSTPVMGAGSLPLTPEGTWVEPQGDGSGGRCWEKGRCVVGLHRGAPEGCPDLGVGREDKALPKLGSISCQPSCFLTWAFL